MMKRKDKWLSSAPAAETSSSLSSRAGTASWCKCSIYYMVLLLLLLLGIPFFILHQLHDSDLNAQDSSLRGVDAHVEHCVWTADSPWLFNIDPQLNVFFTANQWFHVTEMMLSKYHVRHKAQLVTNDRPAREESSDRTGKQLSNEFYFHFKQDRFEDDLAPFTTMMVYWGSLLSVPWTYVQQQSNFSSPHSLHFLSHVNILKTLTEKHVGSGIFLSSSELQRKQTWLLTDNQIVKVSSDADSSKIDNNAAKKDQSVCARYMGSIEGASRKRSQWFHAETDLLSFRELIRSSCPFNESSSEVYRKKKKFKLVFYQRDISRRLLDAEAVLAMLSTQLPQPEDWEIVTFDHSDAVSPCAWVHRLQDTDVFLSPHGFQMTLLYFLPRPAMVLEIFPFHYYKVVYQKLANEVGLSHAHWMSEPTTWFGTALQVSGVSLRLCSNVLLCRSWARSADVRLSTEGITALTRHIQQHLLELQASPQYSEAIHKWPPAHRDFLFDQEAHSFNKA